MPGTTELFSNQVYTMMVAYAGKTGVAFVEESSFLSYYEQQANRGGAMVDHGSLELKFRNALQALVTEGKCDLVYDRARNSRIFLLLACCETLRRFYRQGDETAEAAFPDEHILGIRIPDKHLAFIDDESTLSSFLLKSEEEPEGPPIIKINFGKKFGAALFLREMAPQGLIEAALLKLRFYLQGSGNKEYAYHKLSAQIKGETYVRSVLDQILLRTQECYTDLCEGGDAVTGFWAAFCAMIKKDIEDKNNCQDADIALYQAVFIMDAANNCYKLKAIARRQQQQAIKELEQFLNKPPYLYSLDDILEFINTRKTSGAPRFRQQDLAAWLQKQVSEGVGDKLPELLVVAGGNREKLFVVKSKLLLLCGRLLSENKDKLKDAVCERWQGLLLDYRKEDAMENDRDFDRLLVRLLSKINPVLAVFLEDPKLRAVYNEMEASPEGVPPALKICSKGALLPYSSLFLLSRRHLLEDVRSNLPLRYTLPVISNICAFFRRLTRKQNAAPGKSQDDRQGNPKIQELIAQLVPKGFTIDSYLQQLQGQWMQLTDKQGRARMLSDVNTLIRTKFQQTLATRRGRILSREDLAEMATNLVEWTPSLRALPGKDSLKKYVELYAVKLMK